MRGEGVGDVGGVVGWGTGAAGWALWGGGMEWDAWGYGPWATHCAVGLWALGWRIRSYGAMGRPCPTADSTGTHSLYTTYHGYEVMFHVSTMLPFTPTNPQQVCGARAAYGGVGRIYGAPNPPHVTPPPHRSPRQLLRKRHIGNDIVTIVFQEPGALPFSPRAIRSHFQHVFIVVRVHQPCTPHTSYRWGAGEGGGNGLSLWGVYMGLGGPCGVSVWGWGVPVGC